MRSSSRSSRSGGPFGQTSNKCGVQGCFLSTGSSHDGSSKWRGYLSYEPNVDVEVSRVRDLMDDPPEPRGSRVVEDP